MRWTRLRPTATGPTPTTGSSGNNRPTSARRAAGTPFFGVSAALSSSRHGAGSSSRRQSPKATPSERFGRSKASGSGIRIPFSRTTVRVAGYSACFSESIRRFMDQIYEILHISDVSPVILFRTQSATFVAKNSSCKPRPMSHAVPHCRQQSVLQQNL